MFADPRSFDEYGGPKGTGGFHPDYCLEWTAAGETYRALVCFDCAEVKVYGADRAVHCDVRTDGCNRLAETLRHYIKRRPVN